MTELLIRLDGWIRTVLRVGGLTSLAWVVRLGFIFASLPATYQTGNVIAIQQNNSVTDSNATFFNVSPQQWSVSAQMIAYAILATVLLLMSIIPILHIGGKRFHDKGGPMFEIEEFDDGTYIIHESEEDDEEE